MTHRIKLSIESTVAKPDRDFRDAQPKLGIASPHFDYPEGTDAGEAKKIQSLFEDGRYGGFNLAPKSPTAKLDNALKSLNIGNIDSLATDLNPWHDAYNDFSGKKEAELVLSFDKTSYHIPLVKDTAAKVETAYAAGLKAVADLKTKLTAGNTLTEEQVFNTVQTAMVTNLKQSGVIR